MTVVTVTVVIVVTVVTGDVITVVTCQKLLSRSVSNLSITYLKYVYYV